MDSDGDPVFKGDEPYSLGTGVANDIDFPDAKKLSQLDTATLKVLFEAKELEKLHSTTKGKFLLLYTTSNADHFFR